MSVILPTSNSQASLKLAEAQNDYYNMLANGATELELQTQLSLLTELQNLQNAFETNTPYTNLEVMAKNYFNQASESLTSTNISNAFGAYANFASYLKSNTINYDTVTNTPEFSPKSVKQVFSKSGDMVNIIGE